MKFLLCSFFAQTPPKWPFKGGHFTVPTAGHRLPPIGNKSPHRRFERNYLLETCPKKSVTYITNLKKILSSTNRRFSWVLFRWGNIFAKAEVLLKVHCCKRFRSLKVWLKQHSLFMGSMSYYINTILTYMDNMDHDISILLVKRNGFCIWILMLWISDWGIWRKHVILLKFFCWFLPVHNIS